MNAGSLLRASEASALNNSQFVSSVKGKALKGKSKFKGFSFSVMFLVTLMVAVFAVLFTSGNMIPSAISERLIEETDVQYADAVESKILVFQQSLKTGDVSKNTISRLKDNGVIVEKASNGEYQVLIDGKTISAKDFYSEIHENAKLYNAFNTATYSRAAYYYDSSANEVFKQIGTSRNNYNADSDFDEVMSKVMGEGSDISNNGVTLVKRVEEKNGQRKEYYEYVETGTSTTTANHTAEEFINSVASKNLSSSEEISVLKAAETLNIADTISKEQRSSLFFLAFMENISKMKAGDGSDSKINEAMNYLNRVSENEIVDIETGEVIRVSGSPLESPSLYSVLSKEPLKTDTAKNYSSDRIINTIENQVGYTAGDDIIQNITVSTGAKVKGTIGNLASGKVAAPSSKLSGASNAINSSLINNSFSSISGINAGEMLVEGAVNVGKELAKASGATPGNTEAVQSYTRLTNKVLALDAEVDRMNRSPFDITSKNTFLGSIIYNFAIHLNTRSLITQFSSINTALGASIISLLPSAFADNLSSSYLNNYGNCKTLNSIGAVGTTSCAEIATFDTSTLEGIYDDPGFISFIKNNVVNSAPKEGSILDKFIKYNNKRITPAGFMDGGILSALKDGISRIPLVYNITDLVKGAHKSSEDEKRIATGAAFVNSSLNSDWQTYKYAQRYVSLTRAAQLLKQYSGDEAAYSSLDTLARSRRS